MECSPQWFMTSISHAYVMKPPKSPEGQGTQVGEHVKIWEKNGVLREGLEILDPFPYFTLCISSSHYSLASFNILCNKSVIYEVNHFPEFCEPL